MQSGRIDRWLWAVRVYPTRTAATEGCRGGHVRINDLPAKASATVRVGDEVRVRFPGRERRLEVVDVIEKRVSAAVAAGCLIDHSPPPPPREERVEPFLRLPGTGRPTKRDRRELDRLRRS